MSNDYAKNRAWSDRFVPILKSIVRGCLPALAPLDRVIITEAPLEEDAARCTDLIVHSENIRVMCRTRSYGYLQKYGDEFTLRTSTISGTESEFRKVLRGFGHYLLYGFSNEEDTDLCKWFIGDLNAFRMYVHVFQCKNEGKMPGIENQNTGKDNTKFRAFKVANIPRFIVVEKKVKQAA
jgi:hypothetical protein